MIIDVPNARRSFLSFSALKIMTQARQNVRSAGKRNLSSSSLFSRQRPRGRVRNDIEIFKSPLDQ
jgi:hypothetical protein